jgi:hypothetical protein
MCCARPFPKQGTQGIDERLLDLSGVAPAQGRFSDSGEPEPVHI